MSFVKKVIGPDENLIGISSAHWIYGLKGLLWLGAMTLFGMALQTHATRFLLPYIPVATLGDVTGALFWIPTSMGIAMFWIHTLMMISHEIGLTSKRIIHKRGLILVDVKEVDLEEIKAANVNNGWFGRFLNYGYLVFDARFVTGMDLPAIGQPYRFVKALNDARSNLKEDSMTVVLEGAGEAVQQEIASKESVAERPKVNVRKNIAPSKKSLADKSYEAEQGGAVNNMREIVRESRENLDRSLESGPSANAPVAQSIETPPLPQTPENPVKAPPEAPPERAPQMPPEGPAEKPPEPAPGIPPAPPLEAPPPVDAALKPTLVPVAAQEENGPTVFNTELAQKEKQLRELIKDNFETATPDTGAPPQQA